MVATMSVGTAFTVFFIFIAVLILVGAVLEAFFEHRADRKRKQKR